VGSPAGGSAATAGLSDRAATSEQGVANGGRRTHPGTARRTRDRAMRQESLALRTRDPRRRSLLDGARSCGSAPDARTGRRLPFLENPEETSRREITSTSQPGALTRVAPYQP
jgi:hypothetical protein